MRSSNEIYSKNILSWSDHNVNLCSQEPYGMQIYSIGRRSLVVVLFFILKSEQLTKTEPNSMFNR